MALVQLLRWAGSLAPLEAVVAESVAYDTLRGGREFGRWLEQRGTRVRWAETDAPVIVTREDDRLRIVLNRPRLHNLYNAAMRDALVEALVVAVGGPGPSVEQFGAGG